MAVNEHYNLLNEILFARKRREDFMRETPEYKRIKLNAKKITAAAKRGWMMRNETKFGGAWR